MSTLSSNIDNEAQIGGQTTFGGSFDVHISKDESDPSGFLDIASSNELAFKAKLEHFT